jgi:hypothetical protein
MTKWFLVLLLAAGLIGIGAYFLFLNPAPEYCWLAFGPDARARVLVCMRGETVSLEHYFDGKPTGRTERFNHRSECKGVTVADPDGKTSYVITFMSGTIVRARKPTELFVGVDIRGPVSYDQYCDVAAMTADSDGAPIAQFNGPLTISIQTNSWKLPPDLALQRGDKPTDLFAYAGTFDEQKGCWVVVSTHTNDGQPKYPKGMYPFVDVEFPPARPGDPPLKMRYPLDEFC